MISIVLFYAVMASVFTFGKEVVLYVQPFFLSALRLPLAGLIFLLYEYVYNRRAFTALPRILPFLIAYGISITFTDSARFIALQTLPAANTALVATMAPFIAALVSYFYLRESITTKKIIALCIGFFAILPILVSHVSAPRPGVTLEQIVVAYGAAFFSVLGFVGSGLFIKLLTKRYQASLFIIVGMGSLVAGCLSLFLSYRYETWDPLPFIDMQKALPLVGFLFIVHNMIAFPLYAYLIERFPLTLVAFAQFLAPLFTALLRWLWFNEPITLSFIVSLVALCGALYFFYKEEEQEGLIKQ